MERLEGVGTTGDETVVKVDKTEELSQLALGGKEPNLGCGLLASLQPPSGCRAQPPPGHADSAAGPGHRVT